MPVDGVALGRMSVRGLFLNMALSAALIAPASAEAHRHDATHSPQTAAVVASQGGVDSCVSADCERRRWDESGTIGRMGLGADPYHPEGPGNISN